MLEDADLQALRDGVRDVFRGAWGSERLHAFVDSGDLRPADLWTVAGELGWPALLLGEDQGGLGGGPAETAVVFSELGRGLAPLPMLGAALVGAALAHGGDPAGLGPRIASGELACAAATEPAPSLAIDQGVLSGEIADVLDAAAADLLLLPANGGWVLLDRESRGLTITLERTVDPTRHLGRVRCQGVALPADRMIRDDGGLGEALRSCAALALASDSIGGARAIFDRTLDYLKVRQQFGRPIGTFQALKHRCADAKVALEAASALVDEAVALQASSHSEAPLTALLAKTYACRVYADIAEDAVQMHGGIGFTWEHDAHLFLKRAKLNEALLGGPDRGLDLAADLMRAA